MTLQGDGVWSIDVQAGHETAYHASMRALLGLGYSIVRADPIGGSFNAKSKPTSVAWGLWYRLARVSVDPAPAGGHRIRLGIVQTREAKGRGREPNNDRAVTDGAEYEAIFLRIRKELEQ